MLDEFLEALADAGRPADAAAAERVWNLTAAHFARNGFDKLIHIDTGPTAFALRTTLSPEWVSRYQALDYARIDPFFTHCCITFRPVSTGIAYADRHQGLSAAQMNLIDEASTFGINAGFSSTIRLAGPCGLAGWNIGSSQSRAEVDRLRADREASLRLAARHAHDWLMRARDAMAPPLSRREVDCLRLLARGCRTKDIARTLDLSTAAVELYLRNARRKLGAATREQAVAIATARGITAP